MLKIVEIGRNKNAMEYEFCLRNLIFLRQNPAKIFAQYNKEIPRVIDSLLYLKLPK